MNSKTLATEQATTVMAATVSHPMLHVLGKTEISEVRRVSKSDLRKDDVISYRTTSGIWHMGFVREVGGIFYLQHNYPGKNVTVEDLDKPDLEISTYIYKLVFRKEFLPGMETRLKKTKTWVYDQFNLNCESFIRYVLYGNNNSWSVENGVNVMLHASALLVEGASNAIKAIKSK